MKKKKILRTKKYLTRVLNKKQISKRYVESMNKYLYYHVYYLLINNKKVSMFKYNDNFSKHKYIFLKINQSEIALCAIPINRINKDYDAYLDELFPNNMRITTIFKH